MQNKYTLANAIWEFTLDCNLRCIHCGSNAGNKRLDELTTSEAERVCRDLKRSKCRCITLMGGEPLLRSDFWHIASLTRDLGMDLRVITNGTVYDKDTFSRLKSLNLRTVAVSLDASRPELHDGIRGHRGAFEKLQAFVRSALEEGLPLSVITTVHKMNISELSGIRDMLLDRNIAWQIQIAGSEGGRFPNKLLLDKEEFYSVGMFIASTREKYSLEQMPVVGADDLGFNSMMLNNVSFSPEWNGCHAGISVLGIQSNGDVKGCLSMADLPAEGNVRSANIYDIWNSNTTFSYSRKFEVSEAGENCINCIYVEKCKGGCNEMSLMRTGKLHNDPYCFYAIEKRLFDHELRNPLNRIRLKLKRNMNEIIEKKARRLS